MYMYMHIYRENLCLGGAASKGEPLEPELDVGVLVAAGFKDVECFDAEG
jgi:hypothetical protein